MKFTMKNRTHSELGTMIHRSMELKPKFEEPCNHCGWCCLTEVCPTGIEYGASEVIPCEYLAHCGDKHYCSLMIEDPRVKEIMNVDGRCDAITQLEQLEKMSCERT